MKLLDPNTIKQKFFGKNHTSSSFGVMQGRLLPKFQGRYQAHPIGYWMDEFSIAESIGLECIEFIFDYNDYHSSPLFTIKGKKLISQQIEFTGVEVYSVCADFFMVHPLHSLDSQKSEFSKDILITLLKNLKDLEIKDLVIPCVDQSSLRNKVHIEAFKKNLKPIVPMAEKLGVNLCLETDLPPYEFKNLIDDLSSVNVTVNYDMGNSASLGYDFKEELEAYGEKITDLHIKDRNFGSSSVPLGEGSVDFSGFFLEFAKLNFNGQLIVQAFRDNEGLSIFKKQLEFLNNLKFKL